MFIVASTKVTELRVHIVTDFMEKSAALAKSGMFCR